MTTKLEIDELEADRVLVYEQIAKYKMTRKGESILVSPEISTTGFVVGRQYVAHAIFPSGEMVVLTAKALLKDSGKPCCKSCDEHDSSKPCEQSFITIDQSTTGVVSFVPEHNWSIITITSVITNPSIPDFTSTLILNTNVVSSPDTQTAAIALGIVGSIIVLVLVMAASAWAFYDITTGFK